MIYHDIRGVLKDRLERVSCLGLGPAIDLKSYALTPPQILRDCVAIVEHREQKSECLETNGGDID